MKRQKLYLIVLILCAGMLVGFGKKEVELLNNKLLIDLNLAIHDAPLGNEGSEGTEDTVSEEEEMDNAIEDHEKKPDAAVPIANCSTYKISIRNKTIKYGGITCTDVQELNEKLQQDYESGDKVILIDDYAEAHIYKEVLAILDELVKTKGLEYGEQ